MRFDSDDFFVIDLRRPGLCLSGRDFVADAVYLFSLSARRAARKKGFMFYS